MKLLVQHRDGTREVLTLSGTWSVIEGKLLTRLCSTAGFEHWFTPEGFYDGWGKAVNVPLSDAAEIIDAVEQGRQKLG
jgi:hypothetical protein